jgi:hypothetical protein
MGDEVATKASAAAAPAEAAAAAAEDVRAAPFITMAQRKQLARIGFDAYLQMMLVDSFVHADMHCKQT